MKEDWPALPMAEWRDTQQTLHMFTQVVGKVCLALAPNINHYWGIAFQLGPFGLVTPTMIQGDRSFSVVFNFQEDELEIRCSKAGTRTMKLEPMSVADFYRKFMAELEAIGINVKIWTMPVEIPDPIRFTEDFTHASYDGEWVRKWWKAVLSMKAVMEEFRCQFVGKCSPVHFFWGGFDIAVTRFNGKRAPANPSRGAMFAEAYSHEVISHGFWTGGGPVPEAAFYGYAVPQPEGFSAAPVRPQGAYYDHELGEFILPYDAVRSAESPSQALYDFMDSTYSAAANLAHWDRQALERIS